MFYGAIHRGTHILVYILCLLYILVYSCRAISRDVYRGERPMGVQYHLAFKTSDIRGAGTSANVFLIMHSHQASGAKHHLAATPHDFDRCAAPFTAHTSRPHRTIRAQTQHKHNTTQHE